MSYEMSLLFLCPIVFLASFVDAIAGGGGILSLPAYIFTGLPIHCAYGCNKFTCCVSSVFSAWRFFCNGVLDLKIAIISSITTFLCSCLASQLVLYLPENVLKTLLVVVLPAMALFILLKKEYPVENQVGRLTRKQMIVYALLIGGVIGCYDGMFGPGSGTLAILGYTVIMGYDLRMASGNAKLLVLTSTIAATVTYITADKVIWSIVLPVAAFGIVGSYLGAGFAIHKGSKWIRPMMYVVAVLLIGKMAVELWAK